jgi:hypothetical protein
VTGKSSVKKEGVEKEEKEKEKEKEIEKLLFIRDQYFKMLYCDACKVTLSI